MQALSLFKDEIGLQSNGIISEHVQLIFGKTAMVSKLGKQHVGATKKFSYRLPQSFHSQLLLETLHAYLVVNN